MSKFGKLLREERKDRGMSLADLAQRLMISVPYLSQIETGSKDLQEGFAEKVIRSLKLSGEDANKFRRAAAVSMSEYRIKLQSGAPSADRELASVLAGFARMSPENKDRLRELVKGFENG